MLLSVILYSVCAVLAKPPVSGEPPAPEVTVIQRPLTDGVVRVDFMMEAGRKKEVIEERARQKLAEEAGKEGYLALAAVIVETHMCSYVCGVRAEGTGLVKVPADAVTEPSNPTK